MFVVLVALGSLFVMHYARCIKADPWRSIVVDLREKH
jgi:uncharacterized ion transporter superfamily protein YfcC